MSDYNNLNRYNIEYQTLALSYFIVVVIVVPRRSSKAPLRQLHVVEQLPVRLAQTLSSARARPFRELA